MSCKVAVPEESSDWSLYVLRCADNSLYTGISTDVTRRLNEHKSDRKGAKYLRGRQPLLLEFSATIGDRSLATRVESRVKQLCKADKERLISVGSTMLDELLRSLDQNTIVSS